MNKEEIKQRMYEIGSKMRLIEWDRKKNLALSKDHIYGELKKKYEKLENELKNTKKKSES